MEYEFKIFSSEIFHLFSVEVFLIKKTEGYAQKTRISNSYNCGRDDGIMSYDTPRRHTKKGSPRSKIQLQSN